MEARYKVTIKPRVLRRAQKMPERERDLLADLVEELREHGPVLLHWKNYSALSVEEYHCHLSYHWVACWRHEKGTIEIEVYYAGSRENAPY
ncbi:MAG TPA: hypothetical protein DEB25_09130 [Desulfobulbaceae bacterium]|nr:hypothetical protein [Desulfobulbaceae bacterium]